MIMHMENVLDFDLNLLRAFAALLAERHVTRAAAKVGLTQPAMSHALARLREAIGDPLFVRAPNGMQPTPRAEALAAPLERALAEIDRLVAPPAVFDPKTSRRRFQVAASDYVELVLFPRLLGAIWAKAPHVDVRVVNLGASAPVDLAEGRLDLAIGPLAGFGSPPPRGLKAQKILDDEFVCVVRADHPYAKKKRLDLDDYVALPHALVAPRGERGSYVDTALAKIGRRRRVAIELPHFLVAPHVVAETDVVLTLARRVADALAPTLGLRRIAPPVEVPGFSMSMVWHERHHAEPAPAWLRSMIADTASKLRR